MDEADDSLIERTQEYMRLLLDAGFGIPTALDRSLEYAVSCVATGTSWTNGYLLAAKAVRHAAKNLEVDARSQRMAMREWDRR